MFKSTLSVLSALLFAAACAPQAAPETRDGSVELVLGSSSDTSDVGPSRLTLTSLDRSFHTRVELAAAGGAASRTVRVELPPGLYAVDAAPSVGSDEPVIPVVSAPKLVVVAAGRVSTVNVHSLDVEPQPAVAALDAALER